MKKPGVSFLLTGLLIAVCAAANAQILPAKIGDPGLYNTAAAADKSSPQTAQLAGVSFPELIEQADLSAPTYLRDCESKKQHDYFIEALRDEADAVRLLEGETPKALSGSGSMPDATNVAVTPTVYANFDATGVGSGNPPDNTMAISNGGYVMVGINSRVGIYNTSGTSLGTWSLSSFFNFTGSGVVNDFFDPHFLYDPGSDRFVATCSVGRQTADSRVMVAFSKSNNPLNGWWIYFLTGNPLNNSSWFDFPRIGVSTDDVFITGNLYSNSGTYNSSVIYQMTKSNGYNGQSLPWQYWSNISGSPFALAPVCSGNGTNFGPGIYLIAHPSGVGSSTKLYRITNNMSATNETITYNSVSSAAYTVGANVAQSGTTVKLAPGDGRALSCFIVNGLIHYAFGSAVSGSTQNRIHYHRLNPTALTVTTKNIYSTGGEDFCYPHVAWAGTTTTDKSVVISFEFSKSTIFPGVGALSLDDANNVSSWTTIKAGLGPITLTPSNGVSRWGDYTRLQRKFNSSPGRYWGSTSYGGASNAWIARVFELGVGTSLAPGGDRNDDSSADNSTAVEVYPNPVTIGPLQVVVTKPADGDIRVRMFDMTGRLALERRMPDAVAGENRLAIETGALAPGAYSIQIFSDDQLVRNEKLVIF